MTLISFQQEEGGVRLSLCPRKRVTDRGSPHHGNREEAYSHRVIFEFYYRFA